MKSALLEIMKDDVEEKVEQGREEGKIIGFVEACRDDDKSDKEIIDRTMRKFGLTQEEAEKYVLQFA